MQTNIMDQIPGWSVYSEEGDDLTLTAFEHLAQIQSLCFYSLSYRAHKSPQKKHSMFWSSLAEG